MRKFSLLLLAFLFLIVYFISKSGSLTQDSFVFDLNESMFNFSENRFNDTTLTKDLLFSGSQNITVWISIPKNSTILSNQIDVEGTMKPIQSSTLQQILSLAVGNVNPTNEWDEIVIGTSGSSENIKLLKSDGSQLWNYLIDADVYGVDIGNLSSEGGNEIVAGSTDPKIYLLNSTGNEKWNVDLGNTVNDVDVENVDFANEWDEIAVAVADNRVYLFSSSGTQLWNYTGPSSFKGVGIGNLSSENGNEVVGGSGNSVYMLNSAGNEKWNVVIGTVVNDVDVENVDFANEWDEIAVAGNNGNVFLLNASGNVLWSYSTGGAVDSVSIGEVTSQYTGNEVVVGSYDNKIYVLNMTGGLVWSYTTENDVRGVGIGNLTSDAGSEVAAGTNIPATYTLYILNFEYFPTNAYLDIGGDGDLEWQYPSKFRTTASITNNTEFQNYLSLCSPNSNGKCDVPLVFHSDFDGDLKISSVNVSYNYSILNMVSYSTISQWSRTNDVRVNESVGSDVKNISYTQNPSDDIQVRYIVVDSNVNICDFNGSSYSTITVSGKKVCDISTKARIIPSSGLAGYDWLWDDTMSTGTPVYMNESAGLSQYGFWKKNVTIWNSTATIFTNVTANTTLDELYITGNSKLQVDWYSNGTLYDITPTISQNDCNSNPTYSAMTVGLDVFYVCKQDTNSNSIIDFIIWKQPNTNSSFTVYEVSGSANNPAVLKDINVNPTNAVWGSNFSINVNVTDIDSDNVTVLVCLNLTHTFDTSSINTSNAIWSCGQETNTTQNTTIGEILTFNLSSNITWTGINLFRFQFRDFNGSTNYHDWDYTSIQYGPNVTRHNTTVGVILGDASAVNRTQPILFLIQVNDTENGQAINNANCKFWVSLNDTMWDNGYITQSNSTGHCNYDFIPNSSYTPGLRWWKAGVYNDSYYEDSNLTNYSVEVYGKILINLTQETYSQNITRNQVKTLKGEIFDEFGNDVKISGYTCSWDLNSTSIGSNTTNSTGYCSYSFIPDCSYSLGSYSLNITLSGNINHYYLHNKTEDIQNTFLKENLNLSILYPLSSLIFHKGESMNLNSSIGDSCGIPTKSYGVTWELNCTTESGAYPSVFNTTTGDNTTWTVECFPGILKITSKASGQLYNQAEKNTSLDIYGWSQIRMIQPNNGTYNRTENNRALNISCIVEDANSTSVKLDGYTVDILKKYENGNYTKLTTKSTTPGGFANYSWNISSNSTVPEGWYNIKCNITDQVINSLRKYNASIEEDGVDVLILETDTTPPTIEWYKSNSVTFGSNTSIEVNVTDWYGVDKVWVNLTYPNKTYQTFYLQNTTADVNQNVWFVNLSLNQLGDYDVVIYANDTSNYTSSTTDWFEVYQTIQMYATTDYPIRYTLYRPGLNLQVHQFTNSSGSYNFTLRKRNYDFAAEIGDIYGQTHVIKFNDMNSTATSLSQFGAVTNITNPLNLSNISLSLLNPPVPWRHEIAGIYVDTSFVYSNMTITIDYSNKLGEIDYEPAVVIYKCSVWTNNNCTFGWFEVNSSVNTEAHIVSTTQTNTSAYYAFESEVCGNNICGSGESCSNCPGDCGECGSGSTGTTIPAGSGGGGSSGGYEAYCGNGICDADENIFSCFQDCGNIFTLKTNLTQDYLQFGDKRGYSLWITNKLSTDLTASVYLSGQISSFMSLRESEVTIAASKEREIRIDANIPKNIDGGIYTGEIIVTANSRTERLPVTLFVSSQVFELQASIKAITKIVKPNETAMFEINLYSIGVRKDFDVNLQYSITNLDDGLVIYGYSEKKLIQTPYQFIKSVSIPENVSSGRYYFVLNVSYDNERISSTDTFEITRSILTTRATRIGIIALSVIILTAIGVFGWKKYVAWKLSKVRYIFPVDYNLLPKGDLAIGKVAESEVKATFDRHDLTTHIIVAGATGAGKSVTASIFTEELLGKKIPVVVFDPTAQWTGFVRPCKAENILKYYKRHGLTVDSVRSYPGNIYEMTDPKVKIEFKKYMNPGEITVFVLNKLRPGEYDEAVTNIIDSIFRESWEESTEPKLIIVFDEVHRLLEKYGGKGGYVALEKACREFRKWGIGLIMASQVLSDFKEAIKGNVLTEVQMHTKSLNDLQRVEKKYGLEYARKVAKEEVGIGMMQNPKYNKGLPWFISFRPPLHMPHKISDPEMQMYKDYNSKIEKLEQEVERLEKAGKDVFDLKIEVKLAKDKLKRGMFRVAEIYIDSLNKKLGIEK